MRLERYYTVQEMAEALRKDPSTIRRSIAGGEIPAVDVGDGRSPYGTAPTSVDSLVKRTRGSPARAVPCCAEPR